MINWRIRFKNKTWLAAFLAAIITFLYDLLPLLGLTPPIPESSLLDAVTTLLGLLVMLGVVVDPTTEGVGDSERAMGYE